ncbi:MAG: glycosyltransferase family 4 protein, partial [Candidatus Promineifilaceae bacterium]
MPAGTINQITEAAIPGDAITDQILLIRKWLRESGYRSEIYATHCLPEMESEVRPMTSYRRRGGEETLIYHHAIGSTAAEWLIQLEIPLILIYHNITPSGFFSRTDPALSAQLIEGRRQIKTLQKQTILALADSDYNEVELKQAGYENTGVLPIVIDPVMYDLTPDQAVLEQYRDGPPNLLFLGRLAPNKRQEDLIKLLYYYHRIEPEARLILVGSGFLGGYASWLKEFASTLNLSECVDFPGHVSQTEMIAYFKVADLYVSMSEHEGFNVPLVEAMHKGVPVLARACG